MSKLVKLKLVSKKSLSCFIPNRMASPDTQLLSTEPEVPDDGLKPNDVKTATNEANERKAPGAKHGASTDAPQPSENLERQMVSCAPPPSKSKELPSKTKVEEEEILEIKTPGFVRLFGCDNCDESDNGSKHESHNTSSEESGDESSSRSSAHQPSHLIPVVHLRVPMKDEHDIRKVVAALHQCKGVLEVACDLDNQVVKVTGSADPDRLLKKVKKVKRKSKIISYSNPLEIPIPPNSESFHSDIPPPYAFHQPAYEERFRPPSQPHVFSRESHGPYGPPPSQPHVFSRESYSPFGPPPHFRPNLRPSARPMHYESEAFYHHHIPPPNVRPPPPPAYYRDNSLYPDYIPSNLRPPTSPPHYNSGSFYRERSPPHMRHSTSPPRRRSYNYHERSPPNFRPPPPPMHFGGGPPSHYRSPQHGPAFSYCGDDCQPMPDRMMHMYH